MFGGMVPWLHQLISWTGWSRSLLLILTHSVLGSAIQSNKIVPSPHNLRKTVIKMIESQWIWVGEPPARALLALHTIIVCPHRTLGATVGGLSANIHLSINKDPRYPPTS